MECAFDVTPYEHLVADGSAEFIRACLDALEIEGEATDWSVSKFCSPFFATAPLDHFRDRFPMAWRIQVSLSVAATSRDSMFDVRDVDLVDSTAGWAPDEWEWTTLPAVVIGNFPLGNWVNLETASAAELVSGCASVEKLAARQWITQGRFGLGVVGFQDEARIRGLTDTISHCGAQTNLWQAIPPSRLKRPKRGH